MNMDKPDRKFDFSEFLGSLSAFIIAIIICWIVSLFMGSCKSKEVIVEVEKVVEHHDTLLQTKISRDSIYLHDSIYVREWTKADTVYFTTEKWHTRYQDKWLHDSIYITRFDSIQVPTPYKVEVPVEKKLTKWQSFIMDMGYLSFAIIIMALIAAGIYFAKKVNLKSIISKFIK